MSYVGNTSEIRREDPTNHLLWTLPCFNMSSTKALIFVAEQYILRTVWKDQCLSCIDSNLQSI